MNKRYSKFSLILLLVALIIWTISCSGKPGNVSEKSDLITDKAAISAPQELIQIILPDDGSEFKAGSIIKTEFEPASINRGPDSVLIYFEGKLIASLRNKPWAYNIQSDAGGKVGRASLKLVAYKADEPPQVIVRFITLLSDISPETYGYKVINVFPHDKGAYTQGLVYEGSSFFEGTGMYGQSDLRKVDLKTGDIIKQQKIENQFFGEGVAVLGEKIFQITWTTKTGFVYDKSTFKQINRIYYQTEGWGLATYNEKLVMSDGSNILYFIEPDLFTVSSSIEVYDDKKKVDMLNELEVINGEIWANIYQTDLIARIDPKTGKVLAYINLAGILPKADRDPSTDVLNGIAWDKEQDRIFVTGKLWPKLFEIRLVK